MLEIEKQLQEIGRLPDADVPLTDVLLLLGTLDRPVDEIEAYRSHIEKMRQSLDEHIKHQPMQPMEELLSYRLNRLNSVIRGQYGYDKDELGYNIVEHINLPTVIDRRKGIPVALGVLYVELARYKNWPIYGLNFPGHFLLTLTDGARRLIFDPYHDGQTVDAAGMRDLLKKNVGPKAELNHTYYNFVGIRDIILRFYNNRKIRLIENSQYKPALDIVKSLLWIAPNEARLYFDAGVLSVKLSLLRDAVDYLQVFITRSEDRKAIAQAKSMLIQVQSKLQ